MAITNSLIFQWILSYDCNYYCPYCLYEKKRKQINLSGNIIDLSAKDWIGFWDRINDDLQDNQIFLKGGEPFLYPDFVKIVKKIIVKNNIYLKTNLSCNLNFFINEINSKNFRGYIDAKFHPAYVAYDDFLKKALLLKKKGFLIHISCIYYPAQIALLKHYMEDFKSEGFNPLLLPFKGVYRNKEYPISYSKDEKEFLNSFNNQSNFIQDDLDYFIYQDFYSNEIINNLYKYIFVEPDGSVLRYLVSKNNNKESIKIGNIRDKELKHEIYKMYFNSKGRGNFGKNLPEPHKVFFNWDIHYKCNYRCAYCFCADVWDEISKGDIYPGVQKLINIWLKIYDKYGECRIDISGGEPSIYPDFLKLISEISKIHKLRITTNLSFDVKEFLDYTYPIIEKRGDDVLLVNSSFHPDWVNFEEFFQKVKYLKNSGYTISVTYVAYPPNLGKMCDFKKKFEENNIEFIIQPFRGKYKGRVYPEGYTKEEKEMYVRCFDPRPTPLINYFVEISKQINLKEYNKNMRGEERLCRMGQMCAKIHSNGKAYRCCSDKAIMLGNIITDDDFSLLDKPALCEIENCPCWKAMIVGEEDKWSKHWV